MLYEDDSGYLHIVVPNEKFQQPRETEPEALARLASLFLPEVAFFIVCNPDKIPTDMIWRDAWILGDKNEPVRIDFAKAISIHRKRLFKAAQRKIEQLQPELKTAEERSNLPQQVATKATIRILGSIHLMDMTHCKSLDDIKTTIPKELLDVWQF